MTNTWIWSLAITATDIYAGTVKAGVWKRTLSELILPVELITFTADIISGIVNLHWKTATEVNNFGFNIERSLNQSDWTRIAFVQGNGNSNSIKNYALCDYSVKTEGKYYYRLKQLDDNGLYKYSGIVEVNFISPFAFMLSQNYPNPFNPSTVISYSLPFASNVKLIVYNTLGKIVKVLENEFKIAGNYSINFNAAELPNGIYFYKIEAGQFSQVKKMILVK